MSMLARFKKGGGILELVKLVEESPEPKRTQLLTMIRNEDPEFAAQVESRLFSYDMLKTLPENLIAEIIAATPAKILALALYGEDAEFTALAEKCLGKNFSEYKGEKELVAGAPPQPPQVDAARKKIIAETRKLEAEGKIRLPFSGNDAAGGGTGGGAKLNVGGVENTLPTGTASEDDGVPGVETFGIEAPPPGLSGERLETFLKTQLGG